MIGLWTGNGSDGAFSEPPHHAGEVSEPIAARRRTSGAAAVDRRASAPGRRVGRALLDGAGGVLRQPDLRSDRGPLVGRRALVQRAAVVRLGPARRPPSSGSTDGSAFGGAWPAASRCTSRSASPATCLVDRPPAREPAPARRPWPPSVDGVLPRAVLLGSADLRGHRRRRDLARLRGPGEGARAPGPRAGAASRRPRAPARRSPPAEPARAASAAFPVQRAQHHQRVHRDESADRPGD